MEDLIAKAEDFLMTNGLNFATDLVTALIILLIGLWVARRVRSVVDKAMKKSGKLDTTLQPLVRNLVYYAIVAMVGLAVLGQLGVETTSVLAALGAAGLAIGLALQGTLSNIAAGFMILVLKPFRAGETIDTGSGIATVQEIGLFMTTLKMADGVQLTIPNSQLGNRAIVNYNRNSTRRMQVVVGISYDDDVAGAITLLTALMANDARALPDPAPMVFVSNLADSAVELSMRCWAKNDDFWGLTWDMTKDAKAALEAEGFSIPFPQRDVHLFQSSEK